MIATPHKSKSGSPPETGRGPLAWLSALVRDNIVLTILLMIIVVPLMTGSDLLNTRGKVVAFEALGSVLLLLALSQMRLAGVATRFREGLLSGPNLPVALLALFSLISCAFSPDAAFSKAEAMRIGFCALLYFVLVYHLRGKGHLQTLTDGLLLVTAAASLYGLSQLSATDRMVEGSFGSHELMGSFLMLMLPVALALGLTERGDTKRQLAAQAVALLAAACLLMARTRSAWIGGAFSLVALSVFAWRYQTVSKKVQANTSHWLEQVRQRKHMIVGPLLILGGALVLFVLLSHTGTLLQDRASTMAKVDVDESFKTRLAMDRGAWRMAMEKPVFGWGVGSYPIHAAQFTGFGDDPARVLAHGTSHSNLAHNFYLQTAAELGLVGLGLYLAAVIGFFVVGTRALWTLDNGLRKAVLIGCLAAMAGQVLDAAGSPAYNFASVSLFQWVLMGLGMSAAGLGSRQKATASQGIDNAARGVSRPVMRGLQYGFAALLAVGVVSQIVPTMSAAFAQTCNIGSHSFVLQGLQGQDTGYAITRGMTVPLVGYYDGSPASGTTFVIAGRTTLVTTTTYGGPRFDVTRNTLPGTGTVTVTATYNDGTTTYTNSFVINLR
jgi:O-antigen ligase